MKKGKIVVVLALAIGLFSCGEEGKKEDKKDKKTEEVQKHEEEKEVDHDNGEEVSEELQLNEGAKWAVNEEMMVPVREMEEAVAKFATDGSTEYQGLGLALKEGVGKVTSTCTMNGAAHDELHKWLLPFITSVNKLKECETEEDGAALFTEIQASFVEFNTYFE